MSYFKYGEHASSEKANEGIYDIYEKIEESFSDLEELEKTIKEQNVIQNVNYEFLKRRIVSLENENRGLKLDIHNANRFNKEMNVYPHQMRTHENSTMIDDTYNIVSFLPSVLSPVSYIPTEKGNYIPEGTKIEVVDGFSSVNYVENEKKNMIDNDPGTCWHREYHFKDSSPIREVTNEVIIEMPYSSSNRYRYNNVTINPYPFKSVDILRVESFYDGSWTPIEADIIDAENIYIQTDEKVIEKLKIIMRQRKAVLLNGEKIFYLGINSVTVNRVAVNPKETTFHYDFVPNHNIIINDIKAFFKNKSFFGEEQCFDYEICTVSPDGFESTINKQYPIYIDNTFIYRFKFKLRRLNVIPVLQKVNIKYSRNV